MLFKLKRALEPVAVRVSAFRRERYVEVSSHSRKPARLSVPPCPVFDPREERTWVGNEGSQWDGEKETRWETQEWQAGACAHRTGWRDGGHWSVKWVLVFERELITRYVFHSAFPSVYLLFQLADKTESVSSSGTCTCVRIRMHAFVFIPVWACVSCARAFVDQTV